MAIEPIGASRASDYLPRIELQRSQQKLTSDLAARAAEKLAVANEIDSTKAANEALAARQMSGGRIDMMM
ncbi:hypothetical protein [Actinoplanes friuliensis]|uniref:Uncharacterized protein n=1 Tax=Actinoplanes friuliensis DSM 7358 TaxID=1246995 RepID=U5W3W4_9ACTN|nr:hypothetical protein [Actinoplanes friuliensis]AGZ43824.1 hypothetical protein AFR_27815 [Actinoplanes friuliensis DSM 7358]